MFDPLKRHSFPSEEMTDQEIVDALGLQQPLTTITFKAPQLLAINFGRTHKKFVLSFDKGMGKTLTYLAIMYLAEVDRLLILCRNSSKMAQRRELLRHFPKWKNSWVFVEGQDKAKRKKLWESDNKVFICTYDTFKADMGARAKSSGRICPKWCDTVAMVQDEWHNYLRRRQSGFFTFMKGLNPERLILSSGSAAGKGPQDLWAALHICAPKVFRGYWPYVKTFCETVAGAFSQSEIVGPKNIPGWRNTVSGYVFHRKKDLKDYPPKTRQALEVEMPTWQKKIHDDLQKELMAEVGDNLIIAPNAMAATMKIRQFMVCPKFIDESLGWGAGLEGILADVQESELTHWVISTPFTGPIPWIEAFFKANGYHTERLTGADKLDADGMERVIARWTKNGGPIIQTIKYAESYELPAARIMYMLGYEYSHDQNSQAEDRIHRDIRVTPHPVDIYYVKHIGSYDERVVEILSTGADNAHALTNMSLKEVFK